MYIIASFNEWPDPRVVEPLCKVLAQGDAFQREHAAVALGNIGDPRAAAALTAALHDPHERVRQVAAEALAKLARG